MQWGFGTLRVQPCDKRKRLWNRSVLKTISYFGLSSSLSPYLHLGQNYLIRAWFYPLGNMKISARKTFHRPAPSVLSGESTFCFCQSTASQVGFVQFCWATLVLNTGTNSTNTSGGNVGIRTVRNKHFLGVPERGLFLKNCLCLRTSKVHFLFLKNSLIPNSGLNHAECSLGQSGLDCYKFLWTCLLDGDEAPLCGQFILNTALLYGAHQHCINLLLWS